MISEDPSLPDDQAPEALGTVVQLDARRLDAMAGRRAALSMSRLQADAALLERLDAAGFEGPDWDRFVDVLVEYGCAVLTAWTITGAINGYVACRAHIRLEEPPTQITREDAEDLAVETVADAPGRFRDRVLVVDRWDPSSWGELGDVPDRLLHPAVSRRLPPLVHRRVPLAAGLPECRWRQDVPV